MPIAVVVDLENTTLTQYDALLDQMGLQPEGEPAPGALFQWVAARGDGLRMADVWSDKAAFESYAENSLLPAVAAVGIKAEPAITFVEVHNFLGPMPQSH